MKSYASPSRALHVAFLLAGALAGPVSTVTVAAASPAAVTLALGPASHRLPLSDFTSGVFPAPGYEFRVAQTSGADEYVRDGDVVTLSMTAADLVGSNATDFLLGSLRADVAVTFYRAGAVSGGTTVSTGAFGAASTEEDRVAVTAPFTIPAGTDAVAFLLTQRSPVYLSGSAQTLTPSPGAATFEGYQMRSIPQPVIGAYVPNKLVLFDTRDGARRERVLEGGAPVAGARTTIVYTDYRAETLLDASTLDLRIGDGQDATDRGGDLGPVHPIYGNVEYEVWVGAYDDVHGWSAEKQLTENVYPTLIGSPPPNQDDARFDFEGAIDVPADAKNAQLYFHLKAFVVADAYVYHVTDRRYAAGSRTMIRETYDNPAGAGTNYAFALESP